MVVHGQVGLPGVGVVLAAVRRLVTAGPPPPPPPPHRGRCRAASDEVRLFIHFLLLFLLLHLSWFQFI